jgi:Thioredoxin
MSSHSRSWWGSVVTGASLIVLCGAVGWTGAALVRSMGVEATAVEWPVARDDVGMRLFEDRTESRADAHVLRIVGDYECPACATLHRTLAAMLDRLTAEGHLRVVYVHAPLHGHDRAALAASVAYCVPEGHRTEFHDRLFATAPRWEHAVDPVAALISEADRAGADRAETARCVRAGHGAVRVVRDRAFADALSIHAVPAIFLDDMRLDPASWRALRRYIERWTDP